MVDGDRLLLKALQYFVYTKLPVRCREDWTQEFCVEVLQDTRRRRDTTKYARAAGRATKAIERLFDL